ncbi:MULTISPECIES: LysR family transcriptional regulator [unclassified Rhizobium]|uniref:LysR family transcriptional regulator n=1 Tax=unclassified Rhizobium TaxID=2613769 RepID=UPI001A99DD33|nr:MULTISPECIES: LysR family transcriptional regulator [unclassified Rhizobium]MBX5160548.1 LysR family transcriptional regulator [Rhizobium sp. NZLR8]MBX5170535.1 LysR family transcriptional regulator [Rhizobium sp. NZLR1b]MBX5182632.1 LysR family transcriptional regulator [Rhizobium sp. NZLR5]MBX5190487.1 LysR family transcriptional regulator [Rhizobium sp. NZLR3b]MBX5194745.1 LysR family transcriptional regulator [Rhizobium sp. NZLR10]
MDRFEAMRILLAVVDAGSISAGSRRLNAPLPSVSRKVTDLERHLGANLIVRTSRNLQLTDAGRDYVDAARKIIADLEEAERRASGEYQTPRGVLTITMPIEYGNRYVLPVALGFMDRYPEVSLNLLSLDRTVDLVSEQVDIAIRLGDLADSFLHAVKIGEFRLLTCASPAYLARHGEPQGPGDLIDREGIFFNKRTFFWTFDVDGRPMEAAPRNRLEVNTAANCVAAAVGGAGIARLFDYQVPDQLASGALVPILRDFDGAPQPIHIVYARQRILALKVRAFVDWASPRLGARSKKEGNPALSE